MRRFSEGSEGIVRLLAALALLLSLAAPLAAFQQPNPADGSRPAAASQTEEPPQAEEKKISPQQAEELFRSIDEILEFSSKDTGFPIKGKVKRRLISRDEVVEYLTKHMNEDEDSKRLQRSALVLKKFGLIPRDFDLQKFLVALLKEQVAGFYDPKTKTVNLLDWLGAEQQKPVLAHELTHALQDQSFGLEKWMNAGAADLDSKKDLTSDDIESDELSAARQAVVEGQAMVTLIDYMLAPAGRSLVNSPDVAQALKEGMLAGTADSTVFHDAPIFLKEALTFPYRYGLDFEAALLTAGGKQKAFAGAFADPPRTTRQIMQPQTYLTGEKIPPMNLPDFKAIFRNYDRFDVGAMGEFDVALLLDQYDSVATSHRLYPFWRGGYYYAARPKGDAAAPLALLYVSRWSDADSAAQFAAIYAQSLSKRYQKAREAVADGAKPPELAPPEKTMEKLTGQHTWLTEEGPVVIEVKDDRVMITESLDPQATEEAEKELFPAVAAAK
ncbi:MAG TPA: hypothetical protein VMH85_16995 [Terriglobales bacterium]|nr:hypothetical protein [Terriglobales bacterium]